MKIKERNMFFLWMIALIICLVIQVNLGNLGIICSIFFSIAFFHDIFLEVKKHAN